MEKAMVALAPNSAIQNCPLPKWPHEKVSGVVICEPVDFPCPARGYVVAGVSLHGFGVSLHGLLFLCTGLGFLCTASGFLCTAIGFLCVGVCLTTHAKKRGAQGPPPPKVLPHRPSTESSCRRAAP